MCLESLLKVPGENYARDCEHIKKASDNFWQITFLFAARKLASCDCIPYIPYNGIERRARAAQHFINTQEWR